jgi:hypothetical protein
MEINQAQKDVRETFLGGFAGQLVSAWLWGTSAAVCTWGSLHLGEVVLVLGGFLIFPLTQLVLRSMGHAYALPKGHPMNALGIQVAFTFHRERANSCGPILRHQIGCFARSFEPIKFV